MAYPTAHGFEALELSNLARVTSKTFERLAPYTSMKIPPSPEVQPTIKKITKKVQAYIEAIDASIAVVHTVYQMSNIAATLWTNPASSTEKHVLAERTHRQKYKDIVKLADEAHKRAEKTTSVFKQVQQEFYRVCRSKLFSSRALTFNFQVAASTKDMDGTVQIPVDPAIPTTLITKHLRDIGTDLVSNLNLLADFTRHSSDLSTWCGWIDSSINAADGTVVPPQDGSIVDANAVRQKWDRVHADCLIYHSIISETLDRYSSMLTSSEVWDATMREVNMGVTNVAATGRSTCRVSKLSLQVSNLLQDAVRHLSCHTQSNFGV
ncbi:hypothetical protein C0993_000802 [Termitomyces sp. T159_Od127]|nr:hypothetical protein C0993_000802 [Termitomyces sp. T159_Od127]